MSKVRNFILSSMMFCLIGLCFYCFYLRSASSDAAMAFDLDEMNSTEEWQRLAEDRMSARNDIINSVLDGADPQQAISKLKSVECAPLLRGDVGLVDYMSKNKSRFTNRTSGIKVEYGDIKQLTDDEVMMAVKIVCMENNASVRYSYDLIFKNVKDKWLLSKLSLA